MQRNVYRSAIRRGWHIASLVAALCHVRYRVNNGLRVDTAPASLLTHRRHPELRVFHAANPFLAGSLALEGTRALE